MGRYDSQNMKLTRYDRTTESYSDLDKLSDVLDWLSYLEVGDYVSGVLSDRHGYSDTIARKRAKRILPHARYAIDYINQALESPPAVAFLPTYYAILNLSKIIILCGPYENEFNNHTRWHGATYAVQGKDSRSLLTEEITLKRGGALALLYKTLTDHSINSAKTISMGDVYPYIPEIGIEYEIATKKKCKLAHIDFNISKSNRETILYAKLRMDSRFPPGVTKQHVPALLGFSQQSNNIFTRNLGEITNQRIEDESKRVLRRQYLFHCSHCDGAITPIRNAHIKFTHELPIALMFFHMSSVVRYKPEFLDKLRNGIYWPMLKTGLRHGLYRFMLDTWSYVHQSHYHIHAS